ncbi:uncharacterized protein LOC125939925 [Dermacentor silvarum]|uniref:uncharacterized protein LOC125939925 n=1 Tax=Dermacentor silvarum TaxID=543639 RepID=UPI002100E605|nr:uncharacterized protein LOC125939925 [Dermacentor silvarum]
MQAKNSRITEEVFKTKIESLPPKQKQAAHHIFAATKRKGIKGMVYSKEWMLECIIMKMKGPKLYEHMRKQQILVLPSKATLRKYTKEYRTGFGFSRKVFSVLKEKTSSMDVFKRHGGLLVDEMKLSENLSVTPSGHIDGFVDLGTFTPDSDKHAVCDHGMVIVFVPFVGSWTQIIAVFATHSNVKGNLLAKIMTEAVILAEQAGLFVDFITSDGAAWNRRMWTLMGIQATPTFTKSKVQHPVDPGRSLHFVSDFPHLVKCLRNGLLKSSFNTPAGELFGDTILNGLRLYKTELEASWGSLEPVLTFFGMIRDLIEIMTSRFPAKALRPGSVAEDQLLSFLAYLTEWELHAGDKGASCPHLQQELFDKWTRAIPRADKQLDEYSAVCEKHFDPSELWSMQTFEQTNALSYQTAKLDRDATPPVVHNKIVLFEIEEGAAAQCSIFLNGLLFKKSGFQRQSQAQDLLMSADTLTPCVGIGKIGEFQPLNSESMTKLSQNHAFSLSCDGSSSPSLQDGSSGRCTACKKCRDLLKARLLRLKKKIKRPLARTAVQRLKWAVRTLKKKKMKLLTLQDALKKMREKTSQISASVFEEKLNLLPKKQQAAVRACFDAAKRKSLRGYHYSKEWLLECIILRMKSARLYEHLRAHKILVLPSHACLQKYIKGFTAAYGFNTKLLSCLKAKVKDMDEMKRHGGIVVDEMKLSAHLDMQSSTHIEGFVDLGKFTDASERHEKADHGLVIMFQPFVGKWTQIIGVFSSSGNVKARLLTKILIEATILCEQAGLYLDYICCDGPLGSCVNHVEA